MLFSLFNFEVMKNDQDNKKPGDRLHFVAHGSKLVSVAATKFGIQLSVVTTENVLNSSSKKNKKNGKISLMWISSKVSIFDYKLLSEFNIMCMYNLKFAKELSLNS